MIEKVKKVFSLRRFFFALKKSKTDCAIDAPSIFYMITTMFQTTNEYS